MSKKTAIPAEATPADPHAGHGGSYRVGEDGARTLMERTGPSERLPATEPTAPTEPKE